MLSNPTRIRPSNFLLTPSSTRVGHTPSPRPAVLLSHRKSCTPRTPLGLSLFCHHQKAETFPASFPKKIINSTQERNSLADTKQTDLYRRAATTIQTGEVERVGDKGLRWDFIKKVY